MMQYISLILEQTFTKLIHGIYNGVHNIQTLTTDFSLGLSPWIYGPLKFPSQCTCTLMLPSYL